MKWAWFHPQDSLLGSTGHGAESSTCREAHCWSDRHRGVSNGGCVASLSRGRGSCVAWRGRGAGASPKGARASSNSSTCTASPP